MFKVLELVKTHTGSTAPAAGTISDGYIHYHIIINSNIVLQVQ